jgi:hypothetical protein
MQAAVLEKPLPAGAIDADRLRAVVLVRIAAADPGVTTPEIADDLAPLVPLRGAAAAWRAMLDNEIRALAAAGLVDLAAGRVTASEAGVARAAIFLGHKGNVPRAWDVLEVRLLAKALGLERESAKRINALATADGLRATIVQKAFGLKIKGAATPSRLRAGLAAVALARAFGNQFKSEQAGKAGFSAKAARLLAAQLARKPRDFGTDSRLVAALAAEHVGATRSGLRELQQAVLRRYLEAGPAAPTPLPRRTPAKAQPPRPRLIEPTPPEARPEPQPPASARPDLAGFARQVLELAGRTAHGWPGNRKAYISHVWQSVREARSSWGLTEIEFKCMLAEAHRTGSLVLANADLKGDGSAKDLQQSAVVYRNAVFHFVRVDG